MQQQLPTELNDMQGIFGIHFDKMKIEKDKLFISVKGLFESIWRLDFKTICPFLTLYDFRLDIDGISDEFAYYGKEFSNAES